MKKTWFILSLVLALSAITVSLFTLSKPKIIKNKAAEIIASNMPGVQTPIPISSSGSISNLLPNGSFEADSHATPNWKFGNINRVVYSGQAQDGNNWLDTANCSNCSGDFGSEKTLATEISGNFTAGQSYSASVYFRSPQGGKVELAVWEITDHGEILGTSRLIGNNNWQKIHLNGLRIKYSGNHTIRVQIYYKDNGPGGMLENALYQFDNFVLAAAGECATSYYTYERPLNPGVPTLNDVFAGRAKFQADDSADRQEIKFQWTSLDASRYYPEPTKIQVFYNNYYNSGNPNSYKYYTFSRGYNKDLNDSRSGIPYNMYLLGSNDALNFKEIGPIFSQSLINEIGGMVDAHVVIDYSICPNRYVMAVECSGLMCTSYSTDPFNPSSWSRPQKIVDSNPTQSGSASTGVFLLDGNKKYASWTVVVDSGSSGPGSESTYTQGVGPITDLLTPLGDYTIGKTLLPAEPNTHCTSSWDCNNRDKQDWKKEGDWYYLIYNGGNYYRCDRPVNDIDPQTGQQYTNEWGIGIARSKEPLGTYDLSLGQVLRVTQPWDKKTCAMAYPILNNISGELYMYYWHGGSFRVKAEWIPTPTPIPPTPTRTPTPTPTATPTPTPVPPTSTPRPTLTPTPTPIPTSTPMPTFTPIPTSTPVPTSTPIPPTSTPTPTQVPNTPTLTPTPTTIACLKSLGDADCNGEVNLADFNAWYMEYSGLSQNKTADFNGDGKVTLSDFETWRKNFYY